MIHVPMNSVSHTYLSMDINFVFFTQGTKMSASDGAKAATMTWTTLQSMRTDANFDAFWTGKL